AAVFDLEFALGEEVVLETALVAGPDAVFAGVDEGPLDGEEGALKDPFAVRLDELRFEVVEADRGERLLAVQGAGAGLVIDAAPVVDAVGGVGVLLDFEDDVAGADGVDASAGQEHGVALPRMEGAEELGKFGRADGLFKLLAGDALFQARVN